MDEAKRIDLIEKKSEMKGYLPKLQELRRSL